MAGQSPFSLGERNALLIRSVKSAFVILTKVTKPRLEPDRNGKEESASETYN